jgi:ABC-type multidrug transport system fused ATPase/permease subunit
MWIVIGVVIVILIVILIALSRSRQQKAAPRDAMDIINAMWDADLDKQTSKRAANADEAEIKRLIEEFNNSYDEGGLAAETLAKIGEPAVSYLIEAIQERDGYKFAWGTVALEKMGRKAKAAIPTLQKIANDPMQKENRRREALETIAKIK